ncbi:MAG: hypothetical protein AAGA48_12765 [Myxococcota bacterium]
MTPRLNYEKISNMMTGTPMNTKVLRLMLAGQRAVDMPQGAQTMPLKVVQDELLCTSEADGASLAVDVQLQGALRKAEGDDAKDAT